jgi:exopolyphosphatase/guanosine-5'-triphosphate,3'-diphosphate pyrophosphatase
MSRRVAVIDIGSNSIKLLVAERPKGGSIRTLLTALEEARISRGISGAHPVLSEQGMGVGVAAVTRLMAAAAEHDPDEFAIVATSAVRDARNGAEFQRRVLESTGSPIKILTGDEEAALIGGGLVFDPELANVRDFLVFDLGGGSLECLQFHDRHITRAVSLQLGCVRLTERCVADPDAPFSAEDGERVAEEVRRGIEASFSLDPVSGLRVVATGGSVATARAMLAARGGVAFEEREPLLTVEELETLLKETAALPMEKRRQVPGLPASRADVIPTALATLIEIARLTGATVLLHSGSNLRFGVAAKMLGV